MKNLQIGIIGNAGPEEYPKDVMINPKIYSCAYEIGKKLAEKGYTVVTGGKSGVMEEANRGCKEGGGISVGVVTGSERFTSNDYVDVEVIPGMYNCGEEMCLVTMCDGIIMLGGGAGTLQEVAIAYRQKKPIYSLTGLSGWSKQLEAINYLDERKNIRIFFSESVERLILEIVKLENRLSDGS